MLALRRLLVSRGETHHHTGRFVIALNTLSVSAVEGHSATRLKQKNGGG